MSLSFHAMFSSYDLATVHNNNKTLTNVSSIIYTVPLKHKRPLTLKENWRSQLSYCHTTIPFNPATSLNLSALGGYGQPASRLCTGVCTWAGASHDKGVHVLCLCFIIVNQQIPEALSLSFIDYASINGLSLPWLKRPFFTPRIKYTNNITQPIDFTLGAYGGVNTQFIYKSVTRAFISSNNAPQIWY